MSREAICVFSFLAGWVLGNIWTAWVFKVGPFEAHK